MPRNTPENSFGLSSSYTIQIGPGQLTAMAAYRWRDEVYMLAQNDPRSKLDSIDNLDATISYVWGEEDNYRFSVYGRNMTDEREGQFAEIGGLTGWYSWNQGENYGAEFAVSF